MSKGNILKLGENKTITKAIHGYKNLKLEEIETIYGPNRTYDNLQWPVTNKYML